MEDLELLRKYAQQRSEPAFTELVNRHINFVYSTALRVVRDPELAKDVAQLVFIKLAQKAGSLPDDAVLPGWLYRTTQFVSHTALRSDWRRRERENTAMQLSELNINSESVWKEVGPLLDEAMTHLRKGEQDAVLLRFFSGKSLREIGEALGISEDAAQKRINRALEKLRGNFVRHGAVVSAAAIIPAVSAHAVQAAPEGLASELISSSLSSSGSTIFTATTWSFAKAAVLAKLKATTTIGLFTAVLLFTGAVVVTRVSNKTPTQPTWVLRGTVRTPDGKAVAGALVRVATSRRPVPLYQTTSSTSPTNIASPLSPRNEIDRFVLAKLEPKELEPASAQYTNTSKLPPSTNTAADGSFVFDLPIPPDARAAVVVSCDAGYALVTGLELLTNSDVTVQSWGQIEGVMRIGQSLATNQTVNISIWGSDETYDWNLVWHGTSARTDANGRFAFPRVAPGDVWLTHRVSVQPGDERQSGHQYVRVEPGSQVRVQLGGVGVAVTGRVDWPFNDRLNFYGTMWANQSHGMRPPDNWNTMTMEEKRVYERIWRNSPEGEQFKKEVRNYEFRVQPDGSFRVEDVLPGSYQMQVRADAQKRKGESARLAASAETQVEVPKTTSRKFDEAIDAGVLSPQRLGIE